MQVWVHKLRGRIVYSPHQRLKPSGFSFATSFFMGHRHGKRFCRCWIHVKHRHLSFPNARQRWLKKVMGRFLCRCLHCTWWLGGMRRDVHEVHAMCHTVHETCRERRKEYIKLNLVGRPLQAWKYLCTSSACFWVSSYDVYRMGLLSTKYYVKYNRHTPFADK